MEAPCSIYPLHALVVDVDPVEECLEDLDEDQGEAANCSQTKVVGHFIQDGRRLSSDLLLRNPHLVSNLAQVMKKIILAVEIGYLAPIYIS